MDVLDRRRILVALAGPNGAGKTTFYRAFLASSGLYFVNADVIAVQLNVDPYRAAQMAGVFRRQLLEQRVSFVFETVFSDPVGDKLGFMRQAEALGYTVVLFFIGIGSPQMSDERVAMRVSQGGLDVPADKLVDRYPRVMDNLQRALLELSNVRVYDNSDLSQPYRLVALREECGGLHLLKPVPDWLSPRLPS
ncbi:MAG TPA: zeta toxin family protein [Terracidiphilus sp.]|nr:zeta toxin family protein [Terracidiphilus sp.]